MGLSPYLPRSRSSYAQRIQKWGEIGDQRFIFDTPGEFRDAWGKLGRDRSPAVAPGSARIPCEVDIPMEDEARMEDEVRRDGNRQTIKAFMAAISATDFEALGSVCTEDIVVELPYGDPPLRLEGLTAYRSAIEPSLAIFRFGLTLTEIHPGLDPDLLVAEYTSEGTAIPTGKPYRNIYIGIYRFREGRICGLREFYNPELATKSLASD